MGHYLFHVDHHFAHMFPLSDDHLSAEEEDAVKSFSFHLEVVKVLPEHFMLQRRLIVCLAMLIHLFYF